MSKLPEKVLIADIKEIMPNFAPAHPEDLYMHQLYFAKSNPINLYPHRNLSRNLTGAGYLVKYFSAQNPTHNFKRIKQAGYPLFTQAPGRLDKTMTIVYRGVLFIYKSFVNEWLKDYVFYYRSLPLQRISIKSCHCPVANMALLNHKAYKKT